MSDNKEKIRKTNKNRTIEYYNEDGKYNASKYYLLNKEKFKYICDCGTVLASSSSRATHIRSRSHITNMKLIELQKIIIDNNII